jgi:hypothetical protein
MVDTDYKAVLDGAFAKLEAALQKSRELEVDVGKLKQFIYATMNMLPDEERVLFIARLDELASDEGIRSVGLKEAITRILLAHPKKWFTVTRMRDELLESRFDFRNYTANPLASVSTTLKRMKPDEVETTTIEGVTAYRSCISPETRRRRRQSFGATGSLANMMGKGWLLPPNFILPKK